MNCFQVGGVTTQQISVYEEFARNIPGFLAANMGPDSAILAAKQAAANAANAGQPPVSLIGTAQAI